ncbi:MAG: arginine--tRNA ligase, partial [Acidobacteria bacterium]|nr:arginine--tRNA ligase [Acidobacteriota bacterium]
MMETAAAEFNITLDQIATEVPPRTELGDLAFPISFELAKLIKQQTGEKQNPRAIAETIKAQIERVDGVDHVDIAGPGYLNVFFDRAAFLIDNASAEPLPNLGKNAVKVCVEHTSVNPNKAAHIGHVRNSVLGDTFQRILTATGKQVEVQNYIDNTGVQVADVVVGFIYLENRDLDSIKQLDTDLKTRGESFDYYCWDLYAKVGQEYGGNEDLKARRAEVLHLIEEGNNPTAELADYVATRNVECITRTMERLDIRYDLLPRESEILHLHFWDKAFETMKQLGVVHFVDDGKQKGCWVMPFESHEGTDEHENDKILVRSNGTVTYTGKDIAYQMWKLGILGLDFNYREFYEYPDGKEVWITTGNADTSVRNGRNAATDDNDSATVSDEASLSADKSVRVPSFGGGETIYNVIDTRQSYPQEVVKKGVAAISPERGEKASIHLAYEMVALSPAAAGELGFQLSDEDKQRTFIEMSGRKGLGVKADDLIDRLEANALVEVEARHEDAPDEEKKHIAHQIAVGALRYFLLKFTRNTVIVFDFKEALSFEGETGAFCQYSAVRANSIFRKLGTAECRLPADTAAIAATLSGESGTDIWSLITLASRLEETVHQAANANEPAILAKYTFNLAKAFNGFYRDHKIIAEPDENRR